MDLFSDLQAALQSDLNVGAESSLFDAAITIPLAINRAYRKAASFFKWPATRDALKTSTIIGHEYYDYPQNWQPDSIWKLRVDGVDMGDPLTLKDYLYEQENLFPAGEQSIWANQDNRYLITVNGASVTTNGDNNIEIWGHNLPPKLVLPTDPTIFSYNRPECNEAIVLEALAILRIKGGEQPVRLLKYVQGALFLSIEAQEILTTAWTKIVQEEAKMKRTTQQWNMPDFFATGINRTNSKRYKIGNF